MRRPARVLISISKLETSRPARMHSITSQEKKILSLLIAGKSTKEAAEELHISMSTLRNHISHINQKLHTKNRTEAAMKALKRGII
jgi:DNA-binding NarL/FixJ family response regulator